MKNNSSNKKLLSGFVALSVAASAFIIDHIYGFGPRPSNVAIYVVLRSEISYANNFMANTWNNIVQEGGHEIYVHDFSIDVGGGETYSGRSFTNKGSLIVVVDSPKSSAWIITDPSGKKHGQCMKLFGSEGKESGLNFHLSDVCAAPQTTF